MYITTSSVTMRKTQRKNIIECDSNINAIREIDEIKNTFNSSLRARNSQVYIGDKKERYTKIRNQANISTRGKYWTGLESFNENQRREYQEQLQRPRILQMISNLLKPRSKRIFHSVQIRKTFP